VGHDAGPAGVRQVQPICLRVPGSSGAETAAAILQQEGINEVEIVEHDAMQRETIYL
jgi:hypothetical protein